MSLSERPPGSPAGIRLLAGHWRKVAASAQQAANTLDTAKDDVYGGTLKLQGDYAPKLAATIQDIPGELRKLERGYAACAAAVEKYAATLEHTQRTWDDEVRESENSAHTRRIAAGELDGLLPTWSPDGGFLTRGLPPKAPQPDIQPQVDDAWRRYQAAKAEESRRIGLANAARAMRDEAENTCAREIDGALDAAGTRDPGRWQQLGNWIKDRIPSWDDFVKFCETLSAVLGVVAMFAGPLAPVFGALAAAAAAVVLIDKAMKVARGELSWKQLGPELAMMALNRFGGKALKGAWKAYKKTDVSKRVSAAAHRRADKLIPDRFSDAQRNTVHRNVCKFTGHPVDIASGKLYTSFTDLELPGPLPFSLDRVWFSTSKYEGPFGHGWHHTFDAAILLTADEITFRTPDGRFVDLLYVLAGESVYDRQERLTIARDESGFRLTGVDGLTRRFSPGSKPAQDPANPIVFLLREVVSRAGHRITCSYDDLDRLVEIIDSGGREIGFAYDERDHLTTLTAPHPDQPGERFDVATYTYDELGNLATMTDARGFVFRYAYEGHLLVEETDRTGLTFFFRWDGTDETARCTSTWGDGDLYRRTLHYESSSTVVIDSLGHATRHDHEGGLVVRTTDALGAVTTTEYDYAQPVRESDALGRDTTYLYDWRGNLLEVTTPDGASVEVTFDEHDQPVTAVDQVGGVWGWKYDESGLLTVRRDPLERETHLGYARGLLESIVDPAGGRTVMRYDDQGSLLGVVTPDGASSSWRRNALGWPVSATDPLGAETRRTFDLGGNITRVEEPDGNVRTLEYDGESNLTSAVDVLYDVKLAYQGMGRLSSRTQAGTTVRFEYDTEEQLVGIVNEHGYVYSFAYNEAGLVKTERGFDDILRIYERDIAGRVVSVRRASGLVTHHEYDDADRVVRVAHSDGTSQRYSYRADGALTLAGNDTVDVLFERDIVGRLLRETQGERWVASEYDLLDNRIRMFSSMGADQRYTRNAMGDVMSVEGNGYSAEFTRDALGQELTRALPGGVVARWHRDDIGRPVKQEITGGGGQQLRVREYEWVAGGRLRGILDSLSGPVRYAHDGLGQLVSATYGDGTVELRMPDAVGNLFKTEDRSDRGYGAAGQVLWLIDDDGRRVDYAYDPEGNLISKTADDGERWEYRWYADGNMKSVLRPDGTEVSFTYDALSRRMSKTFRGQTTRWVWDGDALLHEETLTLDSLGVQEGQQIHWIFTPESLIPAAKLSKGSTISLVCDHLGVPIIGISSDFEVTWSGSLRPSGRMQSWRGSETFLPFRFPGQMDDAEIDLVYNRYRYFDPWSGKFASRDPVNLAGGISTTSYAPDPLTQTDFFGLKLSSQQVGVAAERYARSWAQSEGFQVLAAVKNGSEHGIDVILRVPSLPNLFIALEVKGNSGRMSHEQGACALRYIYSRANRALNNWGDNNAIGSAETAAALRNAMNAGLPPITLEMRVSVVEQNGQAVAVGHTMKSWGSQCTPGKATPCGTH